MKNRDQSKCRAILLGLGISLMLGGGLIVDRLGAPVTGAMTSFIGLFGFVGGLFGGDNYR